MEHLLEELLKQNQTILNLLTALVNRIYMPDPIKIITWNINGLLSRKAELRHFLNSHDIDIAMISESHLTSRLRAEIHGYKLYVCNFPGKVSHGGAAIYVKSHIRHNEAACFKTDSIQAACISAKLHSGTSINFAAVYSPPRATINVAFYSNFFRTLGDKWIAGGDYNAKHPYWGSRLTTSRGRALFSATTRDGVECQSAGAPTYWPTDTSKLPDCIDLFLSKGINPDYMSISSIDDLTSDHIPLILSLSSTLDLNQGPISITNKLTDWDQYRITLSAQLQIAPPMMTSEEIEAALQSFTINIVEAARAITPKLPPKPAAVRYPKSIRKLVKKRCQLRHRWQRTRDPVVRKHFNSTCTKL